MEQEKKDALQEQSKEPETEKKDPHSGMTLGLCLGLAIGAGIGAATGNLGLWMPIGMCLGLSLGMAFDNQKKKKDDGDADPQA